MYGLTDIHVIVLLDFLVMIVRWTSAPTRPVLMDSVGTGQSITHATAISATRESSVTQKSAHRVFVRTTVTANLIAMETIAASVSQV